MRAKWIILGGVALIVLGLASWIVLKAHDWQTWLGFSRQDYFVTGQNYAFYSGIGPMMLTALGFGGVIGGLWHAHNCHEPGCWNVGKHRIKGSPWCNNHYEAALAQKDEMDYLADLLAMNTQILAELKTMNTRLAGVGAP